MSINIKDTETDQLARRVAQKTGETITEAVLNSLKERLQRLEKRKGSDLRKQLSDIRLRCSKMKVIDARSADEILGYDDIGVPK